MKKSLSCISFSKPRRCSVTLIRGLCILIFMMILGVSCGLQPPGSAEENSSQADSNVSTDAPSEELVKTDNVDTIFAVNITKAVQGELNDYIELNGDVETRASVDVYADTAGKLTALYIKTGSYVRKDQIIAEVDPSRPGMTFVASPVKSPITGTVTNIPVQIGATISQATSIAEITTTGDLEITTAVAERFISKMKLGLGALLRFEAYPDERFSARITELSPIVDPDTRTMEVKLVLANRDNRIKPGMYAEIKIITEKKEGVVKLPAECIVKRYGGFFVFVVKENDTVERRKVTPGIEIDNKIEVTEGLAAGEAVVIQGQTLLEDNAKIRVIDEIQPLTADDLVE